MSKYSKLIGYAIFLLLTSLLLTGCWHDYEPGDYTETDHTSRTFAITDVHPYPGKGYQIPDKQVGETFFAYIYIINNGQHVKDMSARDVKLTIIDETRWKTYELGTITIDESVGYASIEIKNLPLNYEARVHLHVQGYIHKNKNHEIFAAANSDSFNIGTPPSAIKTITVTPANSTIQMGLTQAYTAQVEYYDGSTEDVSEAVSWSSSDVSKATMEGNIATGLAPGTTKITASIDCKSGTTNLTVTAPELQSILVTPTNAFIQVGQTQTFTAMATYSNGSSKDISNLATWSSSNIIKASMINNVATGLANGNCTITAAFGGQSGTTNLTIGTPVLQSILVTPTNATIKVGQTQTFTAIAIYSNGSTLDISSTENWSSSNQSIATMAGRVATGIAAGNSMITVAFDGQSGTAELTVNAVPPAPELKNRLIWEQEIVDE